MLIHITRHGQVLPVHSHQASDGFQLYSGDPWLTELGVRQARRLGARLRSLGFQGLILCSPYRRTLQTADAVAREVDARVRVEPLFQEILFTDEHAVRLKGATCEEMRAVCGRIEFEEHFVYPWWIQRAETKDDVAERARRVLARYEREGQDILLVGHGATVNASTRLLLERADPERAHRPLSYWNTLHTTFELNSEGTRIVRLADVSHLDPDMLTSNELDREAVLQQMAEWGGG